MAKNEKMEELLLMKVKALYDIELELVEALPKIAEVATDPELKEALQNHLDETKEQVERIERIFDILDQGRERLEVEGIRGMIKDSDWLIENVEEGESLDMALTAATRAVEHYEMAEYTGAQEWADNLEQGDISDLLQETLIEEQMAEVTLASLGVGLGERMS